MTLQKWIKDRAIHGFPTFSIDDVRETGMYSSEQILQNELYRLCSNKTIASVYRGFYVIIPVQYVLRGSVPATYYIDQLMAYLSKPYYVCMLSAAELLGAAHQRPQQFSVMTTFPKRRVVSTRNVIIDWFYREELPEDALITKNTETGTIRISNPLLTAADLVQYQQHIGGLSRVATVLEELSEQINMKSQFASLASFVKKVTWQRLGYILEHVVEENELADELYEQIRNLPGSIMYMPLSTSAENNTSERNSRWKININVQIEKDDLGLTEQPYNNGVITHLGLITPRLSKAPSYKQYVNNMLEKMEDPEFTNDMQSLLRPGISFNASDAYPLIYETFIDKMEGKRD